MARLNAAVLGGAAAPFPAARLGLLCPIAERLAHSPALEVEDFDEAIKYLKDRKVPFTTEPFESPCCHMAIIRDPDGNNIVIHKLKPENEKEPCL